MRNFTYGLLFLLLPFCANAQVVINELDSDTPSTDDKEFIELKSAQPFFALDGYVLVFFNGATTSNRSYFTLDLDGITTDVNGIALIGNQLVSPVPDRLFSVSTIQNGPDAVGLYLGNASDFPINTLATTVNLVDALAHSNATTVATDLLNLLGLTAQYTETATQSIQRTATGGYEVKAPTPGANNDGSGVVFNGVTISTNAIFEIAEGAAFTITFTTQTPVSEPLTFTFAMVGDGFDTSDFTASTTVTIPSGSTSIAIPVTILDDLLDEGDEAFAIRIGELPTGFNRLNDNIQHIIIDNDFSIASWGTPLNPTFGIVEATTTQGYYDSLEGKAGAELKQAIQDIIANPNVVRAQNYGDIEFMLKEADRNPLNSNEVWLMYVEQPRGKYKFQTTASNTGSWNREHIFPQSRGGFSNGTSSTADGIDVWLPTNADDLATGHADGHHLRAEDGPENSSRNNRDYGVDYNGPAGSQGSWHGDVARSLFYMAVRYNALSLVSGDPADTSGNLVMGDLTTLLEWNHSDPSDDFEMNRNNIIYNWQQNRNPFIDYPELADYIWGAQAGQPWFSNLSSGEFAATNIRMYPNPAGHAVSLSGLDSGTLELYSVSGRKLGSYEFVENQRINLELPTGMYLARIRSGANTVVRKLLVK